MPKTNRRCKSCIATRNDKALNERFYNAWFDRQPGGETLEMIAKELKITPRAVYQHAHNHMSSRIGSDKITDRKTEEAAILKSQAMKALEVSFDHESIVPKEDWELAIDQVLADGLSQMKVEGKAITINQIIAAAKIKGDWKSKKRGQDTELIKMMYRSASGFQPNSPNKAT